jgi:hypothetical protein
MTAAVKGRSPPALFQSSSKLPPPPLLAEIEPQLCCHLHLLLGAERWHEFRLARSFELDQGLCSKGAYCIFTATAAAIQQPAHSTAATMMGVISS